MELHGLQGKFQLICTFDCLNRTFDIKRFPRNVYKTISQSSFSSILIFYRINSNHFSQQQLFKVEFKSLRARNELRNFLRINLTFHVKPNLEVMQIANSFQELHKTNQMLEQKILHPKEFRISSFQATLIRFWFKVLRVLRASQTHIAR